MVNIYDHRFSTYAGATQAQLNVGSLPRLTDQQHADPDCEPLARYWVAEEEVEKARGEFGGAGWLFGWRDIARASDVRTMIPVVFPTAAVGGIPLASVVPQHIVRFQALWSSLVFDYVCRQKNAGTHMNYTVVRQLPVPTLHSPAWKSLERHDFLRTRVLELTYTSHLLSPYARTLGYEGPPFGWDLDRRALLRAEIDAAIMHLYGLERDEVEHVLDSFPVLRKYEERDFGEFRTKRLTLELYDRMAEAASD